MVVMVRVGLGGLIGTGSGAAGLIEEAGAVVTNRGVNNEAFLPFADCLDRAFRLTSATGNTFIFRYYVRHSSVKS